MAHSEAADAARASAAVANRLAQANEAAIAFLREAAMSRGLAAEEAGEFARRLSEIALAHGQAVLALHALTSEALRLSAALHALTAEFTTQNAHRNARDRAASEGPGTRRAAAGPPPPAPPRAR